MPAANSPSMENGYGTSHASGADVPKTNGVHKRPHARSVTWPKNRLGRRSSGSDRSIDSFDESPGVTFCSPGPPPFDLRNGVHQEPRDRISEPTGPRSRAYARIRSWADDSAGATFPRISKSAELMRHSYDCVVIGSGYGGGVAASRMARAGQSVCLLERGKERWPGEYPSSTHESLEQVHYSGEFAPGWLPRKLVNGGNPTGMYHLIFGNGQNAVVCNGLGGTSLMNANVYLPADEDSLRMEEWPREIRENPHCLDEYYKKAEEILEPSEYPQEWPKLPKLELLKKQAEILNMPEKFGRVRQTTKFHNGPNSCGVEQFASSSTGQDCTGLNDGSKTTTLVTYLADAWNWGADLFCESEVRYITKAPEPREGYIIYFAWHGRNRGHFKANLHGDLMWVHAKKAVFLGAGAIGTTEILLRSKEMGLTMSEKVGQNMSGNGDILAFGYNTDEEVNSVGNDFPSPYRPVGPCITGIIDNRKGHENPLNGYVIEEGTIPGALAPFMLAMLELLPGSIAPEGESLFERFKASLAVAGSFFLGPYFRKGAVEKTQMYLIMSHDSNQAYLTLKGDKPVLEFVGVGRSDHVKEINSVLQKATRAVGGTYVQNPFYALMGEQEVTVHPIGGACMADSGEYGVTNHAGQVFTGDGLETHEGLIVTDGALIPAALGANPLATITALAERALDLYAKRHDLKVNMAKNEVLDLFGTPAHPHRSKERYECEHMDDRHESDKISHTLTTMQDARRMKDSGFGFTEVMSGHIHCREGFTRDNPDTYELAARIAEASCETARFFLSVQSFNTRSIVHDPSHRALLTGTFSCPTLSGSPFMVQRGEFNLFLVDHKAPGTRNLDYDFDMRGINGRRLHFHGYKVVDSSVAISPSHFWKSTTTLYVTITEYMDRRDDCDAEEEGLLGHVVAKGIMRIQPADFFSELLTMTPTGSDMFKKAKSAFNFMTFFARKSMSLFLTPLVPLQYPSQTYAGFINNTPHTEKFSIKARDGVTTALYMWEPTNTNIPVKNLFMIPGASVDHQIYSLPTIRYNAVNYMCRAGYRVFVAVHRIGALMVAQNDWTTFDARLDLKACLEKIRERYPTYAGEEEEARGEQERTYTIAHCMGSVAFAAGLLDGTIPASWIRGITASQVFMNPIWNEANMIKIMAAPVPADRLYRAVAGPWFSCGTSRYDSRRQRALNELLRLLPQARGELCNNATCHRISLVYARCWNHRNLNEATHRQIDRFFGGVNMRLLHLLMRQGYAGHTMGNAPLYERLDTPDNVARLRGVPVLLFVGRDNAVLSPESTERTYEVLTDAFRTSRGPPAPTAGEGGHGGHGSRHGRGGGPGGSMYHRREVPHYGHLDCWMGRNAWKDVYPFVREEVDRVVRGPAYRFQEPHDKFHAMVAKGELLSR
ncbi:glucose-methanol-choline oxidoreductase [Xylariaceae sp. FL0804]|nr:glucose-methanol-choline oxidoreductase [Xylariaceae sp. FL0804]